MSADAKYQKDSKLIAAVLYGKVEKMESKAELGYEDFIGPLIVLSSLKNLLRAQDNKTEQAECKGSIQTCFDQFERYYARVKVTKTA